MRHLTGFLLALVSSAALFFGVGWGVERIIVLRAGATGASRIGLGRTGFGSYHPLTSVAGLTAVAAVLGVGLLLGIFLAAPRISPLAVGLPGLVLLGWSGLMVAHSTYTLRYLPLPDSHYAAGLAYLLGNGVLALIGAVMIVPMLVPSRWRRADRYVDDEEDFSVPAALGLVP